ncbi:hypothetical protein MJO29_013273 [Puccinia striiformis f. sp. tritici]|uniref:RING-type domain-containing protein n=2 Tax=Puccinia striiformis TaxID=27350 RepID=A0A0L0VM75_9BASI|nr:hypothetical protein Pst134EA_024704 [Puccinia striiformis f. sp. tritici]KNF00379.1 hypothetical protein PSTG_06308 [Puccinia striiformis f. sp. tritici PST-78]POV96812.1 hypothetical protein PSHT_14928 [Puccinia striiformis]KAH9445113.1 hypothetical protein Pst134EB_025362 [Puccinia striiformis f. sp. tritici]KAH9453839.1 hypothetical protein Pst134EA_024704 [Puccinia striiformis f. sp. tritici]KAI7943429.1 hypothetical protein MJO29_013273 [Puccinia striiformis f. sp. tritici]
MLAIFSKTFLTILLLTPIDCVPYLRPFSVHVRPVRNADEMVAGPSPRVAVRLSPESHPQETALSPEACKSHALSSTTAPPATSDLPQSSQRKVADENLIPRVSDTPDQEAEDVCSICLEDWDEKDDLNKAEKDIRTLKSCGHRLHRTCVDKWAREGYPVCPLCRQPDDELRILNENELKDRYEEREDTRSFLGFWFQRFPFSPYQGIH